MTDLQLIELFRRYGELKREYENWLESDEARTLSKGGYVLPSLYSWVEKYKDGNKSQTG